MATLLFVRCLFDLSIRRVGPVIDWFRCPSKEFLALELRQLPNAALQFRLADSVRLILAELQTQQAPPIDCVSLDTKHILARVTENNPKTYVADRFNKHKQPAGDPDCRLGFKRRHNRPASPDTPTGLPVSGRQAKVGEYYWGYGSGVVVAKVPALGEFVIAELTQTFDHADVTYFFPLMQQTEERLGYRPRTSASRRYRFPRKVTTKPSNASSRPMVGRAAQPD